MHRLRATPVRCAATALVAVLALSGCSSDELDVDGFSPGACTDLAPVLQDVDEVLRQVADDDLPLPETAQRFEAAQETLREAGGSAAEPVAASVTELVTRLGFFRIAVDTGTYDDQDTDVRTALEDLAEDCRQV